MLSLTGWAVVHWPVAAAKLKEIELLNPNGNKCCRVWVQDHIAYRCTRALSCEQWLMSNYQLVSE